ncbi:TIM barrel protein [Amylibacter sp. IMCC11727]|uniref:hydroxypyruvate isomerase family protein n=1 Tax=Amylibacter sp. IMCC11727 TaxID=3039851 RepID=UPI00244DA824|nr:TIM barrel protein [Amylibacter sp. IMCC11727]WGI21518.1 TIM barrel protein [Amylibacter sp. IMCC11727]
MTAPKPKFSANLGFLWADIPLPDAIHAAHGAGFDAVECHWPYATPAHDVTAALDETGLQMLSLNTARGTGGAGDFGLSALPDRVAQARAAIDQAIDYATAINTPNIHVLAGNAHGHTAHATFIENLHYATTQAAQRDITILIEPLNRFDAPNYFLKTTDQAAAILKEVSVPNLKLMFDCYHVGRTEGDVANRFTALRPFIGHVQFASVPDRGRPDQGTLDYAAVFKHITDAGYTAPLGAEYKPNGPTDETLHWMHIL